MIKVFDQVDLPVTDIKTSYCKGSVVNINVVNPTYLSYKWYDSQKNYIMDGTKYSINGITTNKLVYIKSLNTNGCLSDFLEQHIVIDNVKALFAYDISTVALGGAVMFTNLSNNASSFSWDFFEGDIIHEQNPIHYYNSLGGKKSANFDVKLEVNSSGGCVDSLVIEDAITVVNDITGIDHNIEVTFSYYPNPVTEKLYLESNEIIKTIKIITASGRFIKSLSVNERYVFIDFSEFKSGIYFLEIRGLQETISNIKVVKR